MPPQLGTPPSGSHTEPSIEQLALDAAQVKALHAPLQQSLPEPQISPVCLQYDETEQTPPAQRFEQQSLLALQLLPSVLQLVFRDQQMPSWHSPLQHSPPMHPIPSELHAGKLQSPSVHTPLTQSHATLQAWPRLITC